MHVIKALRHHSMSDLALQDVYTAIVLAKLLYICSTWWGYATTDDQNHIEAVIHHGDWAGLYLADSPAAAQLLLCDHDYNLRPCPRNLSLCYSMDHHNFIFRLAFKNTY